MNTYTAGAAFASRAVSTAAGSSEEGQAVGVSWSGALGGDTETDTAASASTIVGNAAAVGQAYGLGVLSGKFCVAC